MSPIIAIFGISFSIWFALTQHGTSFGGYFDKTALVLIGVMPPSVMLLSHSLHDFVVGCKILFDSLFRAPQRVHGEVIDVLTKSSALVRANGIGALVNARSHIRYELLRDGISLIVNDFSPDEIRHNLTNKINAKQSRMALAVNLFENMSKLCPGVGMIGTLIGLISMMSNLKNPDQIGPGMALAMITTLYGLLIGTVLYGPCGEKISLEAEKTLEVDLMVLEGVLGLKNKKSSIHMKDIMNTYGQRKGQGPGPNKAG